jgi:hypothetical protein
MNRYLSIDIDIDLYHLFLIYTKSRTHAFHVEPCSKPAPVRVRQIQSINTQTVAYQFRDTANKKSNPKQASFLSFDSNLSQIHIHYKPHPNSPQSSQPIPTPTIPPFAPPLKLVPQSELEATETGDEG